MKIGPRLLQITFGVVNIILFIFGLSIFSLSIWLMTAGDAESLISALDILDIDTLNLDELIIINKARIEGSIDVVLAASIVIVVLSCLGFVGAFTKSSPVLTAYTVFMSLLAVLQLAATITTFHSFNTEASSLDSSFINLLKDLEFKPFYPTPTERLVNQFQLTGKCCGWTSVDNFAGSPIEAPIKLPSSCCIDSATRTDEFAICTETSLQPCKEKLANYGVELGTISIICIILEIVAIIGAVFINKNFAPVKFPATASGHA
jgi:hypothetical protein